MRWRSLPLLPLACRAAIWSLFMAGCIADEDTTTSTPTQLRLPVHQEVLENGLSLIVVPNHTAPVVTALVAFRAGSSVEDASLNGYSHLFEHMMFQGSTQVPDSQDFRHQLQSYGASSNATTSIDRVTYYFDVPSDALDGALGLFADALKEPALDPERLDKERNVVLAEVDLDEASPDFRPYQVALHDLFGDDAVRLDPLGSRDVVANVTRAELLAMHDKYYVPNNALLVLSGDLTVEEGQALAQRHFGDWERAADPFAETPREAPQALDSDRYEVLEAEVTDSRIDVWWQGPSLAEDPEGALAAELLSVITSQTDHDFRSLVGPDLAFSAGLSALSTHDAGYVHVGLLARLGNEAWVLDQLWPTINALGRPDNVTEAQLNLAQMAEFNDHVASATSPSFLPHALGDFFGGGDAKDYFGYVDQLYAVNRSALDRFAQRYLRGRPKVVVLTSPHDNLVMHGLDTAWLRSTGGR